MNIEKCHPMIRILTAADAAAFWHLRLRSTGDGAGCVRLIGGRAPRDQNRRYGCAPRLYLANKFVLDGALASIIWRKQQGREDTRAVSGPSWW
jgi:hypothetical protein